MAIGEELVGTRCCVQPVVLHPEAGHFHVGGDPTDSGESRGHATPAQFGLWATQWSSAVTARWTVERETMAPHGIRICLFVPRHLLVSSEHRFKMLGEWDAL